MCSCTVACSAAVFTGDRGRQRAEAPASMFVVPPVNDGEKGRLGPGHGLPSGPLFDLEDRGGAVTGPSSAPRHERGGGGVGAAVRRGGERGAFAAEELQLRVFEGQLDCLERRRQLAGRRVSETSPGSLTSVPETGSLASMYIAIREPNGFSFWVARYTAPFEVLALRQQRGRSSPSRSSRRRDRRRPAGRA